MEKLNDMHRKQMNDDELEQVAGGINLIDVITTEFIEFFDGLKKPDNSPEENQGNNFGVSTLEMRIDPAKKQEPYDPPKTVKL